MPKFRKKPVTIEAIQFIGTNAMEINAFTDGKSFPARESFSNPHWERKQLIIPTLEGEHVASYGDWIIKGVKGEFYPCKPDIFESAYEAAE